MSNIIYIRQKFFVFKMQKDDNLLDHANKIKAFANLLVCLEVHVREKCIVMTLLDNLPASFKYSITAMDTVPLNKLTMNYITTRMMYKMSKRKEKNPKVRMPS